MKKNEQNTLWEKIAPKKTDTSQFIFYGCYIYRRLKYAIKLMETEYEMDQTTLMYYQNKPFSTDRQMRKYTLQVEKEMRRIYSLKSKYEEILQDFCSEAERSVANRPTIYRKVFLNYFIAGAKPEKIAESLKISVAQVEREINRIKGEYYDERYYVN